MKFRDINRTLNSKDIQLIWENNKDELIKYYVSSQNKPANFENLEYRYTDSKGLKWYGYKDETDTPLDRVRHQQKFYLWFVSGLTDNTLNRLLDYADTILEEGIKNNKQRITLIASIFHDIRIRHEMVRPHSLIFEMLASQYVREDENPGVYDQEIQDEKVKELDFQHEIGNFFFLKTEEYKRLRHLSTMSEEEWKEYTESSKALLEEYERRLKHILLDKKSERKTKTTKKL